MGHLIVGGEKARMGRYREIDHTADVGIEAYGATLKELFSNSAFGMMDLLTDVSSVRPESPAEIDVAAANLEELLVRWLSEILFLFDTRRRLFSVFEIRSLSDTRLAATLRGEAFDPGRHLIHREIKAVTYHGLKIAGHDGAWNARVIFDI